MMNNKVVTLGELLIDFVPTVTGVTLIEAPAFKKAPAVHRPTWRRDWRNWVYPAPSWAKWAKMLLVFS